MVFSCISSFLGIRRGELKPDGEASPAQVHACDVDHCDSEVLESGDGHSGKGHIDSGENSDTGSTAGCCSSGGSTGSAPPSPRWPHFKRGEAEPVTRSSLEDFMTRVSLDVASWDPGSFVHVKTLQDAIKNHTHVDHMEQSLGGAARPVAVKRLPNAWMRGGPQEFRAQQPQAAERPWCDLGIVRYLNSICCPFACDLLGVFCDEENTFAVTSLATKGSLFYWCDGSPRPGPSREAMILPIAQQIFTAITWLHELGIAHRDISLENILLTDESDGKLQVKIIDFAMATPTRMCCMEARGKPSYQAPEMHADAEYDAFLADAFSLGVVLFAMALKDYPWASTRPDACALFGYVRRCGLKKFLEKRRLRNGAPDEHLLHVMSPSLAGLMEGLLQLDPERRSTLGESCFHKTGMETSAWDTEWMGGANPIDAHGLFYRAGPSRRIAEVEQCASYSC
mmetsp:Transcript_34964/g.94762  ORF Transcript_34964/g.94762 Transcript_34964/m.94762 type:complete len:453 (-) Transcript_34964:125-1483(-)